MCASLHDRCRTPRRGVRPALGALVVAAICWGSATAQSDRPYLLVDDGRPMAAALDELTRRYGTIITYEDPRYLYAADIKDVTREVSRNLDRFPPGQAPKVLVPFGGRLDFTYSVSAATGKPENWDALLAALIETNTARGDGARFRFEPAGDVYHVFPAEIRNTAGLWVKTASILDAYITVPEQELTKVGIVEAVAGAISEAMNVRFVVGTCLACGIRPLGPEPTQQFGANNEKARDVLWRALQNWRPGTGWRIFQQPGTDTYVLNATHGAPPEPAARPAMPPPRDNNPARCTPAVRCVR